MSRIRRSRRLRGPAAWALLLALGVPAVAEAQLFPNLPTRKRQRPDCALEAPVYGQYRHQYYGYHPTCWRKFPPGWGCPSHEVANWQAELQLSPLQIPDEPAEPFDPLDLAPPGAGAGPFDPGGPGQRMPEPPPLDRSPFDLDLDRPAGGRPDPFERDPVRPPAGGGSPFDLAPPGGAPAGGVPPLGAVPVLPEVELPDSVPMAGTFEYIPEERLDPPNFPPLRDPGRAEEDSIASLPLLPEPMGGPMTYGELELEPMHSGSDVAPLGRVPDSFVMEGPAGMYDRGREQERRPGFLSRLMFGRGLRR
ncbi:hypothetical protein BH23PLA1_BH23PLA1_11270 [soil metagenome]